MIHLVPGSAERSPSHVTTCSHLRKVRGHRPGGRVRPRRVLRRVDSRRAPDRAGQPLHRHDRAPRRVVAADDGVRRDRRADRQARRAGPRPGRARRGAAGPDQRGDRNRGQDVLEELGHRRQRRLARVRREHHERRDQPGRVDDHAAARQEPDSREQAGSPTEGEGARPRLPAQQQVLEAGDPQAVPEHRVLRAGLVRRESDGTSFLPHARSVGAVRRAGQAARRAHGGRVRVDGGVDPEPRGRQPLRAAGPRARHGVRTC